MSDNIPVEVQMEIIQRIPDIRSVIQFRSVSKAWKSMIDSKEFVTGHTRRHIQQQPRHLLIKGVDFSDSEVEKYVSIVDDDTFPHQKLSLLLPNFCKDAQLIGSSHGLICFYDYNRKMFVIWNPSIRKTVVVPYESCSRIHDVFFGVCHNTLDPKIVKFPCEPRNANTGARVEVFTSSIGIWRSPLSNTCPRKSIYPGWSSQAVVDGFIYWDALDNTYKSNGGSWHPSLIMSFDLTSEEFTELYLPNSGYTDLYVSNLRESLGVFQFNGVTYRGDFNVWIMKGRGCTRSFEKLYHINPFDARINMTYGFRASGAPIVEMRNYQLRLPVTLAAYEPESKNINEIWRHGVVDSFRVHSYMETLMLLSH